MRGGAGALGHVSAARPGHSPACVSLPLHAVAARPASRGPFGICTEPLQAAPGLPEEGPSKHPAGRWARSWTGTPHRLSPRAPAGVRSRRAHRTPSATHDGSGQDREGAKPRRASALSDRDRALQAAPGHVGRVRRSGLSRDTGGEGSSVQDAGIEGRKPTWAGGGPMSCRALGGPRSGVATLGSSATEPRGVGRISGASTVDRRSGTSFVPAEIKKKAHLSVPYVLSACFSSADRLPVRKGGGVSKVHGMQNARPVLHSYRESFFLKAGILGGPFGLGLSGLRLRSILKPHAFSWTCAPHRPSLRHPRNRQIRGRILSHFFPNRARQKGNHNEIKGFRVTR